ncbi:Poly [ADP-ribose] polymerase 14 [Mizuhopecten yessoensis]|uniref:Poly [ADP-ribose] polymerase 14 n=1 Tax=Mizuhopecten yessoensis TaxID=6573 RepID=A0A210Q979_MIZYE|nr:Poly [ADP-ribose] polymerase 14 [Mizuhopecten yessoensis]
MMNTDQINCNMGNRDVTSKKRKVYDRKIKIALVWFDSKCATLGLGRALPAKTGRSAPLQSYDMSDTESYPSGSDDELNTSDFNLEYTDEEGPPAGTSGETTVTLLVDGVLIRVVKGNIAEETVDVIVNSTSTDLDLKKGTASRILLKASGDSLQTDCRQKYPNGITVGDVAITEAGNLPCDHVYHGSLVKWGTDNAAKVHTDFVTKCLEMASDDDLTSIAMPGLTTGFLAFPKDIAAKNACEEVRKFIESHQDTSLRDIRIVIYEKDRATLKAFSSEVKAWKDRIDKFVPVRDICSSTVGGMTVRVVVDKMEDQKVDVIVNSANKELKLDKGTLSNTLNRVAGPALQQSCSTLYPQGITPKGVAFTDAGNLSCKKVYHVCMCDFDRSNEDESSRVIIDLVCKCLEEMDSHGLTSISFPALGTRFRKYPSKLSAKAMFEAFEEFWSSRNTSSVTDVRIVIYGNDQHTVGKAFEKQTTGAISAVPCPQLSKHARGTKSFCLHVYEQSLRAPRYWSHFKSSKTVKKWKVSPPNGELHRLVPVSQEEKKAVESLIENTWETNKIGHGRDAVGLGGFTSLKVTNIQRLENIDLFEKYGNARATLFHKAGSIGVFDHLEAISGSKGAIKTANMTDQTLQRDTFPEVNEYYFFHGTKPDILESILKQGMDVRMSGDKAMFGQGMYFAESSTKADQYADPRGQRSQNEKTMLLARVCLGKICLVSQSAHTLKRPPCFVAGCNKDTCSHSDLERCDSVVGDGMWLFREMERVPFDIVDGLL